MKNLALIRNEESTFCKLSLDNGATWIQGIVVNFSEQDKTIRIFLTSKNFYRYYNSKNKAIIKTLDDKNEYIYIGRMDSNLLNHKCHFIKVNIEQTLSFDDNRKSTRYLVNCIANVTCENGKSFNTKVFDVSLNGLSFLTNKNLEVNSKISISVKLNSSTSINLSGIIVNRTSSNSNFRYSVKTEAYTSDDEDLLSNLIEDLLLKQNGIYKKYTFMQIPKKIAVCLLYLACLSIVLYLLYLLYLN